jgi:hypothetical protein
MDDPVRFLRPTQFHPDVANAFWDGTLPQDATVHNAWWRHAVVSTSMLAVGVALLLTGMHVSPVAGLGGCATVAVIVAAC